MGDLLLHRLEQGVVHLGPMGGKHRHFPILQIAHLPGVLDDGGDIRGQHVEVRPVSQDQGRVLPHCHQPVWLVGADDAQGISPLDAVEHLAHRVQQVAFIVVVQQLGHHLRICLRDEGYPLGLQKLLQPGIVLDDPVVDHSDPAGLAHLGVGVDVVGRPVGSPAGMPQPHVSGQLLPLTGEVGQHLEPPLGLGHLEPLLWVQHRQPRGVIPPVLQAAQPLQQDGGRLFRSNISYDTTHCNDDPPELKWRTNSQPFAPRSPVTAPLFCGRPHISSHVTRPERRGRASAEPERPLCRRRSPSILPSPRRPSPGVLPGRALALLMGQSP